MARLTELFLKCLPRLGRVTFSILFFAGAILNLAGCVGSMQGVTLPYAASARDVVPQEPLYSWRAKSVRTSGGTYWVFDSPALNRLLITPSVETAELLGDAMRRPSFASGQARREVFQYETAARRYLGRDGRACSGIKGEKIGPFQWRIRYRCQ